jgi:hypothetical protein
MDTNKPKPDSPFFIDETPATPLQKYALLRITAEMDIAQPIPVITINGEMISTAGNITSISGASKSGKSAFTAWIIAGAISIEGDINDPLEGLEIRPNKERKAVIHFDTEQARHKHQRNLKSILRRVNVSVTPDYYLSYNLRQLDLEEYAGITSEICELAFQQCNGIHLIVIDGIADYIKDVNDAATSNEIVKFFEGIAIKFATPVIVIIHTNPGGEKERGNLGSQLQRKSESVLTIKQNRDISYLEPKFLREAGKGEIKLLQFTYEKSKGYHVGCGAKIDTRSNKDAERIAMIQRMAKTVFVPPNSFAYNAALEKIMKESNKKESTAKGFFKDMKAHNMIIQGDDNNWRLNMEEVGSGVVV